MKQRKAGIFKGVSEAVYPDDILSDQELQGAPLDVIGAWCGKVLQVMWRDKSKKGSVTDTVDGFARFWGTTNEHAAKIIECISARKIGTVSRDCHGNVTLTCRRLERRYKAAEDARLRKERERAERECHAIVTGEKPLPPSPYPSPSPSPSPSPVPVDTGDRGADAPVAGTPATPAASPADVLQCWNALAKANGLPECKTIKGERTRHLQARLKDAFWAENWRAAIGRIPQFGFLLGQNDRGWRADIDWFLRPNSVAKVIEGKYSGGGTNIEDEQERRIRQAEQAVYGKKAT